MMAELVGQQKYIAMKFAQGRKRKANGDSVVVLNLVLSLLHPPDILLVVDSVWLLNEQAKLIRPVGPLCLQTEARAEHCGRQSWWWLRLVLWIPCIWDTNNSSRNYSQSFVLAHSSFANAILMMNKWRPLCAWPAKIYHSHLVFVRLLQAILRAQLENGIIKMVSHLSLSLSLFFFNTLAVSLPTHN